MDISQYKIDVSKTYPREKRVKKVKLSKAIEPTPEMSNEEIAELVNYEWLKIVVNEIKNEPNTDAAIRKLTNAMLLNHSKRLIKILKCDKSEINYMVKLAKWIEKQK